MAGDKKPDKNDEYPKQDDLGPFGASSFMAGTGAERRVQFKKYGGRDDNFNGIGHNDKDGNDDFHDILAVHAIANSANLDLSDFFRRLDEAQDAFNQEKQNKITITFDNPFAELSLTEEDKKIERVVYQDSNGEYFYIGDNGAATKIADAGQLDQINRQVAEGKTTGDMKTAEAEQNLKQVYTGNGLYDPFDKSGTETYAQMTGETTQVQEHLTLEMEQLTLAEQFNNMAEANENGNLTLDDVDKFARNNPNVSMAKIAAVIGNEGFVLDTSGDTTLQQQYSPLIKDPNIVKVPDYSNNDVGATYNGIDNLGPKNAAEQLNKQLEEQATQQREQQLRLAQLEMAPLQTTRTSPTTTAAPSGPKSGPSMSA